MPGPGQSFIEILRKLFMEPIFQGLLPAIWTELRSQRRSPELEDESVGSLLKRRFGTADIGHNIVSAVFHGIYAGDIYQLSAKSLLPKLWYMDGKYGSLLGGTVGDIVQHRLLLPARDVSLLVDSAGRSKSLGKSKDLRSGDVYTFENGISSLSERLETLLARNPKVQIKTKHEIKKLQYDGETDSVKVYPQMQNLVLLLTNIGNSLKKSGTCQI
jgi:oxygen-dependent protoporphyrinogen oxidase